LRQDLWLRLVIVILTMIIMRGMAGQTCLFFQPDGQSFFVVNKAWISIER